MSAMLVIVTFITALVLAYAGLRGGAPERWAAAIIGTRYVVDALYHALIAAPDFYEMDRGHALFDALMLVGFTWLSLRSNRVWPIWLAASTLIAVLGHIFVLAGAEQLQRAYWAMVNVPHFVQLFVLMIGTMFHQRRLHRIGNYRDWS